tara:strand:+ start:721 stop:996 length:276 start_codon:yes stop_codon:yes gene_type:complete
MKEPKKKKDININIDTKNVDIKVTRKDGVTDVKVDTDKVDVDFHKESNSKELKIDTDKVDVQVTNGEVNVDVNEQSGLIGKLIKLILRRKK